MVFVSVGTQKQSFKRLFHYIEDSKILENQRIIAQSGHTQFNSSKIECIPFMSNELYKEYIEKADIVICHGGVGTIFDALYKWKKVLAVPRLSKYGEHVDDHQIEICKELEEEGYIGYLKDNEMFDDALKRVINTDFKVYITDESYLKILKEEI